MYKLKEKNGRLTFYNHFETVFYKVLSITGNKAEAMEVSDRCQLLKAGETYEKNSYCITAL